MTRKSRILMFGGAGVVALTVAAAAVYYFVLRSDSPPPVSIEGAVSSLSTPGAATHTADSSVHTTPISSSTSSLTGEWTIASSGSSFVGYRVQEQLARIGTNTAVGRTSTITASMTFDGASITKLQVTADLTKLRSDESLRDGQLQNQAIETRRFPNATFVLTSPISIGSVPGDGQTITRTVEGDLTLHGVTKRISMDVQGQFKSGQVVVIGSTTIVFADYNVAQPRGATVLSIDDHGIMELQLIFQKAAG